MRHIKLPHAVKYFGSCDPCPLPKQGAAKDHRGSIPRDEDEDLGCIAEAEGLDREIAQHVPGNVIDENQKKGAPTEEIEPKVARRGGRSCRRLAVTRRSELCGLSRRPSK